MRGAEVLFHLLYGSNFKRRGNLRSTMHYRIWENEHDIELVRVNNEKAKKKKKVGIKR